MDVQNPEFRPTPTFKISLFLKFLYASVSNPSIRLLWIDPIHTGIIKKHVMLIYQEIVNAVLSLL